MKRSAKNLPMCLPFAYVRRVVAKAKELIVSPDSRPHADRSSLHACAKAAAERPTEYRRCDWTSLVLLHALKSLCCVNQTIQNSHFNTTLTSLLGHIVDRRPNHLLRLKLLPSRLDLRLVQRLLRLILQQRIVLVILVDQIFEPFQLAGE